MTFNQLAYTQAMNQANANKIRAAELEENKRHNVANEYNQNQANWIKNPLFAFAYDLKEYAMNSGILGSINKAISDMATQAHFPMAQWLIF